MRRHAHLMFRRGPEQVAASGQARCLLDRQPARAHGTLCTDHHDALRRMLDPCWEGDRDEQLPASIPVYWSRLDPTPATTDPRDRRSPGFESSPPLALQTVVLRDDRSYADPVVEVWWPARPGDGEPDFDRPMYEADGEPRPVRAALESLVAALWDDLGLHGPLRPGGRVVGESSVAQYCNWLLLHVDDIAALPHADEVFADLADLQHDLRGPAGDPADRPIGRCTGWVHDPDGEKVECKAPLFLPPPRPDVKLPPTAPVLRCRRCDRPYSTLMLLRAELSGELAS